ncbi:MAG TPA: GerMN domain-containing protein [Nocardioides sp.]|uniref:AMIN-like domain-containing (lipo)protein n=1 Tax=Nocardioides sp. TaxID=35761 RepID=UPI002E3543B9|nr:GerMN domain-containing protein [Nocardioides sp.]HEX5088601.1 GerMN domain-containing protein [Nocardioides sp.]
MTALRWPRAALPLLAICLLGPAPVRPATATTEVVDRAGLPVLTSVKARHVGNVDRVVFRFTGGVPTTVFKEWRDTLAHDGSGLPVRVAGTKILVISMNGAVAHDANGSTVAGRTGFALPNVITAVAAGDFEGSVLYGIGVQKQTSFHVSVQAHRVVVEVGAAFPTTLEKVFFVDSNANLASVTRRVPTSGPATAVLHSLFAGPTPAEKANGFRLVRSRATGFTRLSITDGIARVRLTGGCRSGGSTTTVASEIVPSLKQFPTVKWVKVYDSHGRTETPNGPSDSIPACLEP